MADKYIANWKSYLDKRIAERKKHSDHKIPDEEKKRLLEDLKTCQDDAETEITEMSSGDIYVYIAAFVEYHINAMGKKKKKVP